MKDGIRETIQRPSKRKLEKGNRTADVSSTVKADLQLGKECSIGKLLVVLAEFLLAGFQVIEELSPTNRPCDTSPSCPEVLHPAQGATIQQNSGLGYCCKGNDRHFLAVVKTQRRS